MSDFSLVHRITEIKDNTGEKLNVLEVSLTFYPFIILLKFWYSKPDLLGLLSQASENINNNKSAKQSIG